MLSADILSFALFLHFSSEKPKGGEPLFLLPVLGFFYHSAALPTWTFPLVIFFLARVSRGWFPPALLLFFSGAVSIRAALLTAFLWVLANRFFPFWVEGPLASKNIPMGISRLGFLAGLLALVLRPLYWGIG